MKKVLVAISVFTMIFSCQLCCTAQTKLTRFDTVVVVSETNNDINTIRKEVVELAKKEQDTQFYVPTVNMNTVQPGVTLVPKTTLRDIMRVKASL